MPDEGHATFLDHAAYWLTLAGVYLLAGFLFLDSGKAKLFDEHGHAPASIKQQFQGSFVSTFPGVDALWVIVGVLEFGIALIMVVSLIRLEFLPSRTKPWLLSSLALALFTFACLSFGETTTGQFAGTASLYSYFGSTAIILMLVLVLPARGRRDWISRRLS